MSAPPRLLAAVLPTSPGARYLVFGLAVAALYFRFPDYHLLLWTPLGGSAVVATVVGIRRYRPRQLLAWCLLAAGEFFFIAGDTTYTTLRVVFHQPNPSPSLADGFYLLTYLCLGAGLMLFIRARSAGRDRADLIDAVIITTGLALVSWIYLVIPNFEADGLTNVQRFVRDFACRLVRRALGARTAAVRRMSAAQ